MLKFKKNKKFKKKIKKKNKKKQTNKKKKNRLLDSVGEGEGGMIERIALKHVYYHL